MAPIGFETQLTDKERLIRIETIVDGMAKSSAHFETTILELVRKLEENQTKLEKVITAHLNEDGDTYRKLRYEILKYLIITVLGGLAGAFLTSIGLFGG